MTEKYPMLSKIETVTGVAISATRSKSYLLLENLGNGSGFTLDKPEMEQLISELTEFAKDMEN